MTLKNTRATDRGRGPTPAKRRLRLSTAASFLIVSVLAGRVARADGFDARVYRPSSETNGIGTLDGARAPDAGVISPSIGSDLTMAPVTLEQGAATNSVISARWVVEPQLSFGLGSSFGIYARAPIIATDSGRDVNGNPLPTSGVLPPALGVLIPIARNPLNDGRLAVRGEVDAPVGSAAEFRGDGQVTARGSFVYGGYWHGAYVLASVGGQLAPLRGVGDAQLGRSITAGFAVRIPIHSAISAFGSADTRFDVDVPGQSSGLVSLGAEMRHGHSTLRLLASVGIRDVIGTPRAMIALTWSFDVSSPPAFLQAEPAEPPPSAFTGGERAEAPSRFRALY